MTLQSASLTRSNHTTPDTLGIFVDTSVPIPWVIHWALAPPLPGSSTEDTSVIQRGLDDKAVISL